MQNDRTTCGIFNWGIYNFIDFYMKVDLLWEITIFCEVEEWQAFKNQRSTLNSVECFHKRNIFCYLLL